MDSKKRPGTFFEVEILAQEAPGFRTLRGGAFVFVSKCLDIADHPIDDAESALKWRTLAEGAVAIDGADLFAELGMRPNMIARYRERAVEIVEAIRAGFARRGKAKRATGAALAEPEAGARIGIVKLDANFHIAASRVEAVDGLGLPCFRRACKGGAPQESSSIYAA